MVNYHKVELEGNAMKCIIGVAAGFVTFFGLAVVSSETSFAQVSGTFAFTGGENCITIVPPATFNSSFEPSAGPIFNGSSSTLGLITFNANGTGSLQVLLGVDTSIPAPPGTYSSTNSNAGSFKNGWQFNYTVSGGIILMTLVSGSYSETYMTGPRAGQTATLDARNMAAYVSMNNNNVLAMTDETYVETKTYSNGDVRPSVCHRKFTGFTP
jgi:hypothetical protein